MAIEKKEINYSDLKNSNLRFLDYEDGEIDVSGKIFQGTINNKEKKFHIERWCTFPFNAEYSLEELKELVVETISLLKIKEKALQLYFWDKTVCVNFSLEESLYFVQEIIEIIKKMEEIFKAKEQEQEEQEETQQENTVVQEVS